MLEKSYHLPALSERKYQNPLPFQNPNCINPDPYILKFGGRYYCYSTDGDGVSLSRSDDLIHFEHLGFALSVPDQKGYWAPSVIYKNGKFYMYYSSDLSGTGEHSGQIMRLAVADSPEGPFTYKKTLFERFSIDSHIVRDLDGEYYLFYTPDDYEGADGHRPGVVILVDRLIDMETPEGKPKMVIYPSIDEEIYEKNRFGDGRDWYTIEGGFYFTHNNTAYTMYSGNAFYDENYFLGYAKAPLDAPIGKMKWEKYPDDYTYEPLVRKNEFVEGTGHNSVVKAPNGIGDWIAYHGRSALVPIDFSKEERQLRIDPAYFDYDRLWTNAPTHLEQSAPPMPFYRDLFTCNTGAWHTTGVWSAQNYEFTQFDTGCVANATIEKTFENYFLEVDLKGIFAGFSNRLGILLSFLDDKNFLAVMFNSGRSFAELILVQNGIAKTIKTADLDKTHDLFVMHNLQIERSFNRFTIKLDGMLLMEESVCIPAGFVGLRTEYSKAVFAGFSVTGHVNLFGDSISELGHVFESDIVLPADNRSIINNYPVAATLTSKFTHSSSFEQNISLDSLCENSKIDFYPAFIDKDNLISVKVVGRVVEIAAIKNREIIYQNQTALNHNRFTVKTVYINGKTWLAVSNRFTDAFDFDCIGACVKLSLERAAVLEFECTNLYDKENNL